MHCRFTSPISVIHPAESTNTCQALFWTLGTKLWIRLQPRKGSCLESNTCPSTWEAWEAQRDVFIQKYLHKGNLFEVITCDRIETGAAERLPSGSFPEENLQPPSRTLAVRTPEWRRECLPWWLLNLQNFCASKGQQMVSKMFRIEFLQTARFCLWLIVNSVGRNKEIWHFRSPHFWL